MSTAELQRSPDKVLTCLAQLATCQTKTERSLISLFDESMQYIVAEATSSTFLVSKSPLRNSEDGLSLPGTCIPRVDGVCYYTLCATQGASASEGLQVIVIQDLSTDSRFPLSSHCYLESPARFYAAVPIRSPGGINIGVLSVMNSTPGFDWKDKHSKVLQGLSQTIMDHLEGDRIKHSLKRSMAMNLGLQRFSERVLIPRSSSIKHSGRASPSDSDHKSEDLAEIESGHASDDHASATQSFPLHQQQEPRPSNPFRIAAIVIKEALDVDNCAFFRGDSHDLHMVHSPETETTCDSLLDRPALNPSVYSSEGRSESSDAKWDLPCQLLGASNDFSSNPINSAGNLSQIFLSHMLRRYPEGCILDLKSNSNMPSHQNTNNFNIARVPLNQYPFTPKLLSRNDQEMPTSAYEQRELLLSFPEAQNIAFIPIWDPVKGVLSIGGFVWSKASRRRLDKQSELPFFRAIGILAASEAFQTETMAAERAKSDVLSSISHELRSPIHGITLGLELLNDSGLSLAQQNIAHLIGTCCHTLLDTTEHLLDYSKVNQSMKSDTLRDGNLARSKFEIASLCSAQNPNKEANLDQIAEDVVESVYVGQIYQRASMSRIFNPSSNQKTTEFGAMRLWDSIEAAEARAIDQLNLKQDGDVSVFLLYDPTCSWCFQTRAGAICRIIMNLLGNSLKYTSKGFIKVSMTQTEPDDAIGGEKMIELVVEDTGRGISKNFLRNNIFKPFSQEDQLSTGTGLGLSLVQRITFQLGGTVSIKSQVDVGTEVTVSIPMLQSTRSPTSELFKHESRSRQSSCHGLHVRMATQSHGAALHALMNELCYEHLGMVPDVISDGEQLAPDITIIRAHSKNSLSELDLSWPDAPILVVCDSAFAVQQYESAYASPSRRRLYDFVVQP